jgi:hypothetical protein
MGYGMAIAIDTKKMLSAVKVGKTIEDVKVMVAEYRAKFEADSSTKNYRLMCWACNVLEGQLMIEKGFHKMRIYEIVKKAIDDKQ